MCWPAIQIEEFPSPKKAKFIKQDLPSSVFFKLSTLAAGHIIDLDENPEKNAHHNAAEDADINETGTTGLDELERKLGGIVDPQIAQEEAIRNHGKNNDLE